MATLPPAAVSYSFSTPLTHFLLRFLDGHFATPADLRKLPSLSDLLDRECRDLDLDLRTLLGDKLSSVASAWVSRSQETKIILRQGDGFIPYSIPASSRRMLEVGIPLIVKEVSCIETIRLYAELSLQLEALVGELEDTSVAIISQARGDFSFSNLGRASTPIGMAEKHEKLLNAVKTVTSIEDKLGYISSQRPQWAHLMMTVDSRVEKALAILKPQALSDHRAILASLGWPPSLSSSNVEKEKSYETPNPLSLMHGEKKDVYSQSFLILCTLQQLFIQREERKLNPLEYYQRYKCTNCSDFSRSSHLGSGLWSIDELVRPIASRMEHHFHRWSNQPKFIFALVYKITRDFMDGVDHVLQPLVDKARCMGSSVREAWVAAMVKILIDYLEKEAFPVLVERYEIRDGILLADASWLHLVDLMITFDKRMRALAISGMPCVESFLELQGMSLSLSTFSVFVEHSDWLHIWAEIELDDANEKLNPELESQKSWSISTHQQALSQMEEAELFLLSNIEDFRAPPIADSVVKIAWNMVERAFLLPTKMMKVQFIRSSMIVFLNNFFHILVQRCHNGGSYGANMDVDAMLRLAGSINVAQYLVSVLRQWSEDFRFLEMSQCDPKNEDQTGSFLKDETMRLIKLDTDFLEMTMSSILLQFDDLCRDYIDYIEQWGREQLDLQESVVDEQSLCISSSFVRALDMLKDHLYVLRLNLNSIDFLDLWRSIADGLDHFIFNSITLSVVKFTDIGVNQYKYDMRALIQIFSAFCSKPESFFPRVHESMKLLTLDKKDVANVLNMVPENGKRKQLFLQSKGVFHVTIDQAKTILRKKIF
ncbi:hypothetical protein ZIOFF_029940 [Zingiber officinale]|uniref:RINT1-like protein MAG2L n=1 Tax=Zingiber officinale TaxID=94328 RepID=A0A8J5GNJ9_ZINOF|nr:hypothetical protein ZIOFF_029940 [Zingiber officinale]